MKKIAQIGRDTHISDDYKNYESIISDGDELYCKEDFLEMIIEKPLNKLLENMVDELIGVNNGRR